MQLFAGSTRLHPIQLGMDHDSPIRARKLTVATSILLLLVAMMLPVCHIHPLLNKTVPDHCTICVSLHAAAPLGVHIAPAAILMLPAGSVVLPTIHMACSPTQQFKESRGPPLPIC